MKIYNNFNEIFNESATTNSTLNVFNQVAGSVADMWFVNKEKYSDTRAIVYYLNDAEYKEKSRQTGHFSDYSDNYQIFTGFMTDPETRQLYKSILEKCIDGIDNYSLLSEKYENNVYKVFSTRPLTSDEARNVAEEVDKIVVQLP